VEQQIMAGSTSLSTDALVVLKFLDDHEDARIQEKISDKYLVDNREQKIDLQVFLQLVKHQVIERDNSRPLIDQWQITDSGRRMARLMLSSYPPKHSGQE
jgi:hypothetical protein